MRQAVAIGLGVFLGGLPLPGLHRVAGRFLAALFSLRASLIGLAGRRMPVALMPLVLLFQVELGVWLRSGAVYPLALDTLRTLSPASLLLDAAAGALASGLVLGLAVAAMSLATLRHRTGDPVFDALAADAGERYDFETLTLWQFANAKVRFDFVYREALRSRVLPDSGTVVDIGCSQGLMLAVLAAARQAPRETTPAVRPLPSYDRLVGIELRPQVARQARRALGAEATIIEGDAAAEQLPAADAVLVFDVLHLLPDARQRVLLASLFAAIRPGGALLVREAPEGQGLGFAAVQRTNRFKAWLLGSSPQALHFRTASEWEALCTEAGFVAAGDPVRPQGPLGNALFAFRRP